MSIPPACLVITAFLISVMGAGPVGAAERVPNAPTAASGRANSVPAAAWTIYRDRFIQPDGRLVDTDNGGVSHSEGQGYGMLLAVMANDPATFGRLWTWTAEKLFVRGDNLAAWRWHPDQTPNVPDNNNATDGDLLISWALARAAKRWNRPDYRVASRRIGLAVGKLINTSIPGGPVLPPASFGFGREQMADGPVINLSYLVFPAFDELKTVAPEVDWERLRRSSASLVERARFGPSGLPADWISLASPQPQPAQFQPGVFGYESIRIPLYLAWSSSGSPKTLGAFANAWKGAGGDAPSVVDLKSGTSKEPMREPGYRAVVALTQCAAAGQPIPGALLKLDASRYYPATLQMLSLAAVAEKYPSCMAAASR